MRRQLCGMGVSDGTVVGTVAWFTASPAEPSPAPRPASTSASHEKARFQAAREHVRDRLQSLAATITGEARDILEATGLMATDPALATAVERRIDQGASAERATWDAGQDIAAQFEHLGGYLADRAPDVRDVRNRILGELAGTPAPGLPQPGHPFVLVALDLAPADTATLDPAVILAIVTEDGGAQSHTAILARSLGIPAVVGLESISEIADGQEVLVDGAGGTVVVNPAAADHRMALSWAEEQSRRVPYTGVATFRSGQPVTLLANVGGPQEAIAAARLGATGVGLFRTEFCFLGSTHESSVDQQRRLYRKVLEQFAGGRVTVRTLDAGADKPLAFLTGTDEANPALGVRGFRTSVHHEDVLRRQLDAIVAAGEGLDLELGVMAPMVATVAEARRFASLCREAGVTRTGIMIEIPSAALSAEPILHEVDFVSLGTNDLAQYTMAADRELAALNHLTDPWQPPLLRLVKLVAEAGARARADGRPGQVGVCGEAAADPALAVVLLGLGVTSLSMTARALAPVSAAVSSVALADAHRLANEVLAAEDASTARETVSRFLAPRSGQDDRPPDAPAQPH